VMQYSPRDYSERIWVCSKKDTNYYRKMVAERHIINKCVSFTTIFIILSIPCSFTCCISLCCLNSEVLQSNILNQMMAYLSQNT
jgi:tRNA uridine 5-carbamoylmethylation protein Kti12